MSTRSSLETAHGAPRSIGIDGILRVRQDAWAMRMKSSTAQTHTDAEIRALGDRTATQQVNAIARPAERCGPDSPSSGLRGDLRCIWVCVVPHARLRNVVIRAGASGRVGLQVVGQEAVCGRVADEPLVK